MGRFSYFLTFCVVFGCAPVQERSKPVPQEKPAQADPLRVQMCTPGSAFKVGASYMLIKIDGYELFFRKVEYECSASDNSVVLLLNQQKIERTKESCKVFHAQAFPLIPRLLFMRKVGTDELPIVYSRTDMIETIARLFAEHPCLRQATTASYTTP